VVQATATAQPVLEKLRKEASLIEPILTGDRGEAAILSFAEQPQLVNDFTSDFGAIAKTLRNLDARGGGGSVLDAVRAGIELAGKRSPERRRVLLLISEKHDRSSKSKVEEVVTAAQRSNVMIYAVSFSAMKTPFTTRAVSYCDPPNEEKKCSHCDRTCGMCARQCYRDDGKHHDPPPRYEEASTGGLGIFGIAVELARLAQTDLTEAFAKSSGGMSAGFLKKAGLEKALERIGADLHNQYLISFQPEEGAAPGFHTIRVEVKGRPELLVRARAGYWKN